VGRARLQLMCLSRESIARRVNDGVAAGIPIAMRFFRHVVAQITE
jgi:hypothetical protein